MSKAWLGAVALGVATVSLASCGSGDKTDGAPAATATPDAPQGITVSDGRMNLPAVSGNPGAVYFTVANSNDMGTVIRSVHVNGVGSTMLHQTATWNGKADMQQVSQILVPASGKVELKPGGFHVMAMNIDDSLKAGGETEATVTFAGGDKVSFPVRILAPGVEG